MLLLFVCLFVCLLLNEILCVVVSLLRVARRGENKRAVKVAEQVRRAYCAARTFYS